MLKKKVLISFLSLFIFLLFIVLQAVGQDSDQGLTWGEQEEASFDIFKQEIDDAYSVLSVKFKELAQKHKSAIETLVKLNPELAVVYTISLKELIADSEAMDQ